MDVTITQETPILIKAEVTIPWDRVAPHQDKALVEIKKHAQVPGFRKGKAPTALLKKRFKQQIMSELSQSLLPEDMDAWIKEKNIRAVGSPRLLELDVVDKQHLRYVAQLDVKPEFDLADWKGLEVESLRIDISDEDVAEALQKKLDEAAQSQTITDRPAEAGDEVTIVLTALDGEAGEVLTDLDSYSVDLGSDTVHETLSQMVTGMAGGEDKQLEFEAPADDPFDDWRGKKVKLFVEVTSIKRTETPQLDDAFAQSLEKENLAQLRQHTREELLEQAKRHEANRLEYSLLQKLVEPYSFEVPQEMIMSEAQNLVEIEFGQYLQIFRSQKQKVPRELVEQLLQMQLPKAYHKVYSDLVLEKIAAELKLEASAEERQEELEKFLPETEFETIDELAKHVDELGNMASVDSVIVRRKAVEAIRDAAKLKEVDELTPPPEHDHDHDHHDHDHDHHDHDHDHHHDHDERVGGIVTEDAEAAVADQAATEKAETKSEEQPERTKAKAASGKASEAKKSKSQDAAKPVAKKTKAPAAKKPAAKKAGEAKPATKKTKSSADTASTSSKPKTRKTKDEK